MGQSGGISSGVFNCYPKPGLITDEVFCHAVMHNSLGFGWYDDEKETRVCTYCYQRIHALDKTHVLYCRGSSLTTTLSAWSVGAMRRHLCMEFSNAFAVDKGCPLVKAATEDSPMARYADMGVVSTRTRERYDIDFTWVNNEGILIASNHPPSSINAPAMRGGERRTRQERTHSTA